jgi:NADPH:quinone reductase-like Zn-dependent oxidoreductase
MVSQSHGSRVVTRRPREGDVRVRVGAVGVSALGTQIAGTIEAVGPDSAGFARNDRVAFRATKPTSSQTVVVDERDLIGIPSDVSLDAAAAIFPCALLARTVVRQSRVIGPGIRVAITDASVVAPFVVAWIEYLGGTVLRETVLTNVTADVVVSGQSIRTALDVRTGHGLTQQSAADVFAAMRAGAFDSIALSSVADARNGSRLPVLLHPAEVTLAA